MTLLCYCWPSIIANMFILSLGISWMDHESVGESYLVGIITNHHSSLWSLRQFDAVFEVMALLSKSISGYTQAGGGSYSALGTVLMCISDMRFYGRTDIKICGQSEHLCEPVTTWHCICVLNWKWRLLLGWCSIPQCSNFVGIVPGTNWWISVNVLFA